MNRLNIKRTVGSCLMAMAFFSCTHTDQTPTKDFVDYVNPYIGNISHLLVPTYPTVHLPNSMLRVYPERGDYTSDRVNGLPVVVTSHRGSSAFNLSPVQGEVSRPIVSYSYDLENITPYSYSVYLDEAGLAKMLEERPDFKYLTDIMPAIHAELAEKYAGRYFSTPKKMGAQTAEANINAGIAAAKQIVDFLVNGNEKYRVNK